MDVAVTFLDDIELSSIVRCIRAFANASTGLYVLCGQPRPASANKMFFSLWSSADLSLIDICETLSESAGLVCTVWKSEHGGVAGYVVHESGQLTKRHEESGDGYMMLPVRAMEKIFGRSLRFESEHDSLSFPEMLLSDVRGFALERDQVVELGPDLITSLLEFDLDAEPVLP